MKELSENIKPPFPIPPQSRRPFIRKRWKQIMPRSHPNNYCQYVIAKINNYLRILETFKQQYLQTGELFFENNLIHDPSDPFTIYSFATKNFYWYIECDLLFDIHIRYAVEPAFKHAFEIHHLIRVCNLLDIAKEIELDLKLHFALIASYQPAHLILTKLPGETYLMTNKFVRS